MTGSEAPAGARRSASAVLELAAALIELLEGTRPETAAESVLEVIRRTGGAVGPTARLELMDRLFCRLRAGLSAHDWWLHGPNRARMLASTLGPWLARRTEPGGVFVELGCGRENPLALSTLMYLNGLDRCLACDVDALADGSRAALALYDLLLQCLAHPDEYRFSRIPAWKFEERLRAFELKELRKGALQEGLGRAPLRHAVGSLEDAWRDAGAPPVDLVASFAVLEHPADLPALVATLARIITPGGMMIHQVDFRDHRSYASTISPWGYLIEGTPPQDISNEIRCSAMVQQIESCGFRLIDARRTEEEPPPEVWQTLRAGFQKLPARDITTQQADLYFERI